jgi:AcrR family transcriptional regulator
VVAGTGLRERKKQQTRQLIVTTAQRLFRERGFDTVTVAEVARAAEVSEGTVFNYFPSKEDIFYGGMEIFEERLIEAVRQRASGTSALDAFRRLVLDGTKVLAEEARADLIATAARVVTGSQDLQAREREIVARYTQALADLLAAQTGARAGDVEPLAMAAALMGVQRALVRFVRASVLSGVRGPKLARAARSQATRAFTRLERGLGDYCLRPNRKASVGHKLNRSDG